MEIAIGEAFADNNEPSIYAVGDNTLNIVFVNEKYDCLIDNSEASGKLIGKNHI